MRALILIAALLLTACATGERMQTLRIGMSKADVMERLGRPDGMRRNGDSQALVYKNRMMSGWSWDRADYSVILEEGRVVEYGPGNVRQSGPDMVLVVP